MACVREFSIHIAVYSNLTARQVFDKTKTPKTASLHHWSKLNFII